jgi:hypothetical protein
MKTRKRRLHLESTALDVDVTLVSRGSGMTVSKRSR